MRTLRAHLTKRRERKLKRGDALPQYLFASSTGTHADPTHVRHAFSRVCVAAGLTKIGKRGTPVAKFSPHSLRHTYAALHLQAGTDLYYVSRQLGHADITLTVHTYGAWLQPNRRANLDALDRIAAPVEHDEARG